MRPRCATSPRATTIGWAGRMWATCPRRGRGFRTRSSPCASTGAKPSSGWPTRIRTIPAATAARRTRSPRATAGGWCGRATGCPMGPGARPPSSKTTSSIPDRDFGHCQGREWQGWLDQSASDRNRDVTCRWGERRGPRADILTYAWALAGWSMESATGLVAVRAGCVLADRNGDRASKSDYGSDAGIRNTAGGEAGVPGAELAQSIRHKGDPDCQGFGREHDPVDGAGDVGRGRASSLFERSAVELRRDAPRAPEPQRRLAERHLPRRGDLPAQRGAVCQLQRERRPLASQPGASARAHRRFGQRTDVVRCDNVYQDAELDIADCGAGDRQL